MLTCVRCPRTGWRVGVRAPSQIEARPSTVFPSLFPLIRSGVRDPFTRQVIASSRLVALILPSPQGCWTWGETRHALWGASLSAPLFSGPPNPSSFDHLASLWDHFHRVYPVAMTFWYNAVMRISKSTSRSLVGVWRDVIRGGGRCFSPLQKSKSARCDALADRVQACAEQQRLQVIVRLRITAPTGSQRCLHSSFMYMDIQPTLQQQKRQSRWWLYCLNVCADGNFPKLIMHFWSEANFERLSILIFIHSSCFCSGLHPFSARKNKRRSLESLESGDKQSNPFVAGCTDTLTTCSHCTVG